VITYVLGIVIWIKVGIIGCDNGFMLDWGHFGVINWDRRGSYFCCYIRDNYKVGGS
jgi:hypothetical protein